MRKFYHLLLTILSLTAYAQEGFGIRDSVVVDGPGGCHGVTYIYHSRPAEALPAQLSPAGNRSERQVIISLDPGTVLPDQPCPTIEPGDGVISPEDPRLPHPGNSRPDGGRPPFAYSGWVPGLLFYRYDYLEIMNSI